MTLEQEKHIADLNAKLEELVNEEKDLARVPVFLHFDPCDLETLMPDISKHEMSGGFRLDARASMDLALILSQKTNEFFKAYADKFSETQGKRILLDFARQEEGHSELISQRLIATGR